MSCVFCKIVSGEIPSHKIYEDDHVVAFLDLIQSTKGHTLVVPKNHHTDVFDMTPESMQNLFKVVPALANSLKKTFGAVGMNMEQNSGAVAGQSVFHYHVHLLPRYGESDGVHIEFANNMAQHTPDSMGALKQQILSNLGNAQTGE